MGERRGWAAQEAAAGRQAHRGVWEAQGVGGGWSDPGGAVAKQELCRMGQQRGRGQDRSLGEKERKGEAARKKCFPQTGRPGVGKPRPASATTKT